MPDAPYNRMLASLEPITLAEMDSIRLMNRIDSKYVTDEVTLGRILADAFSDFRSVPQACAFVAEKSDFTADRISPRMTTAFDRITLVNAEKTERLTIDLHLHFHNVVSGLDAGLGPAVIIELKQDGRADSRMKRILLERRVKPIHVSKYCIGTTLTDPTAKSNRFKLKIKKIEKVIHEKIEVPCVS